MPMAGVFHGEWMQPELLLQFIELFTGSVLKSHPNEATR